MAGRSWLHRTSPLFRCTLLYRNRASDGRTKTTRAPPLVNLVDPRARRLARPNRDKNKPEDPSPFPSPPSRGAHVCSRGAHLTSSSVCEAVLDLYLLSSSPPLQDLYQG